MCVKCVAGSVLARQCPGLSPRARLGRSDGRPGAAGGAGEAAGPREYLLRRRSIGVGVGVAVAVAV